MRERCWATDIKPGLFVCRCSSRCALGSGHPGTESFSPPAFFFFLWTEVVHRCGKLVFWSSPWTSAPPPCSEGFGKFAVRGDVGAPHLPILSFYVYLIAIQRHFPHVPVVFLSPLYNPRFKHGGLGVPEFPPYFRSFQPNLSNNRL